MNKKYLLAILETQTTAVLLFDSRLRLLLANPAAEGLLQTSEKKIKDMRPKDIFADSAKWEGSLDWALSSRRPFSEHGLQCRRANGDTITVDCVVTPTQVHDGEDGLLVELIEVDRHHAISRGEQTLAQHETTYAMVRGLAHEIRNPLGGLRGAAQLLERELDNPELLEFTQVIIGEADRLQGLLDRMLGPRSVPQKRPFNVHQATDRVCTLVRAEVPDGVIIQSDYDPSIPEVEADPDLLIQALLNIVRNSAQAIRGSGRDGCITVRTRVERQVTIGGRRHRLAIRLQVIDNGPGISEEMMDKIFYPMVSGRAGGSGLGLSIAQNLIHLHGGYIDCESVPGNTVVTAWLPLENDQ
ncbi:MAG: nitrogen regulation protein NR(II) [Gammaproteobacteria bacterium]|nr:nitrogen regulation protein NR(II) [Gammaproteobacteria bacterium]